MRLLQLRLQPLWQLAHVVHVRSRKLQQPRQLAIFRVRLGEALGACRFGRGFRCLVSVHLQSQRMKRGRSRQRVPGEKGGGRSEVGQL
jgi:hypothetical protein